MLIVPGIFIDISLDIHFGVSLCFPMTCMSWPLVLLLNNGTLGVISLVTRFEIENFKA